MRGSFVVFCINQSGEKRECGVKQDTQIDEILVKDYFHSHAPDEQKGIVPRTINALERAGVQTMGALLCLSHENLAETRCVGEKSLRLALMLQKKFVSEKGRTGNE